MNGLIDYVFDKLNSNSSTHLKLILLWPGELSLSRTRKLPLMPELSKYSAAFLEIGPWYQECFSSEFTGVT